MSIPRVLATCLIFAGVASIASAAPLLVSQGVARDGYGLIRWENMTALLDTATDGQVQVTTWFDNFEFMLGFDTLWVDQRSISGRLTSTEIANIAAFGALGRRVVMIGEHQDWEAWNRQIMAAAGGDIVGGTSGSGAATPIIEHYLTEGVSLVSLPSTGIALGGTVLFDTNFATLWGREANILTILDENIFNAIYWNELSNARFASNVAGWVTYADIQPAPVPEPSTLLLVGVGCFVLSFRSYRFWRRVGALRIALLFLGAIACLPRHVTGEPILLDQSSPAPIPALSFGGGIGCACPADQDAFDIAQTFTVGMTGVLTRVDVFVNSTFVGGDLFFDIRPTLDAVPVDTKLLSFGVASHSVQRGSSRQHRLLFHRFGGCAVRCRWRDAGICTAE